MLKDNPENWNAKRLHEVRVLKKVIDDEPGEFVAFCEYPITVRNSVGKTIDEWDGVVFSLGSDHLRISIVEAKYGSSKAKRADDALNQLKDTKKILSSWVPIQSQCIRIAGQGAKLLLKVV